MRYNFLVLHDVDNFDATRRTHVDGIKCFERYVPGGHNYLYHRLREPITEVLRKTDFHVVVLTATALAFCRYCRPRELYYRLREAWSFIGDLDAVKLAFPQDDYHQTNDIDALFAAWGMDVIYSVVPRYMNIFYPLSSRSAKMKGVLTGYVDDNSIQSMYQLNKPFEDREFDIVQRVKMHPHFGGHFSKLKGRMADRFAALARQRPGLRTDISTLPNDVLTGDLWLELLGNGRFALGSEGGVSLWDPDGMFLDREREYLAKYPKASFEEVETACFPGEDGRYVFSTVSPRLFECAMMGCCQILIEGEYLGLLKPWEHFIPVQEDLSDVEEALDATADVSAAKYRIAACYQTLIENPALRYGALVREVMEDVERLAVGRGFRETSPLLFREMVAKHSGELSRMPSVMVFRTWTRIPPSLRRMIPSSIRKIALKVLQSSDTN